MNAPLHRAPTAEYAPTPSQMRMCAPTDFPVTVPLGTTRATAAGRRSARRVRPVLPVSRTSASARRGHVHTARCAQNSSLRLTLARVLLDGKAKTANLTCRSASQCRVSMEALAMTVTLPIPASVFQHSKVKTVLRTSKSALGHRGGTHATMANVLRQLVATAVYATPVGRTTTVTGISTSVI